MSENKDYYKILGIEKTASPEEIKKAYRTLAKKFHPDVNQDNKEAAEAKFKEISESYEVLIDPKKKQVYDTYGYEGISQQFGQGGLQWDNFTHMDDISDIFSSLFGGRGGRGGGSIFESFFSGGNVHSGKPAKHHGGDIKIHMKLTLKEMYLGDSKTVKYTKYVSCSHCKGTGSKNASEGKVCKDCGGTGQRKYKTQSMFGTMIQVGTCPTCQGEGKIIDEKCTKCFGEGRVKEEHTLKINVPAGVFDNDYMRIDGEGNTGKRSGTTGDLIVIFTQTPDKNFKREDDDLYTDLNVSFPDAILSADKEIELLDGKTIKIKVPEGTESGKLLLIKGKGMPSLNSRHPGNLFVRVNIIVPKKTGSKLKNSLKELNKMLSEGN